MKANFYGEPTMTKQGKTVLSFSTDDRSVLNLYDELHGGDVMVTVTKYRKSRGLSQNAMYWTYLGQLARKLGYSNARMHNVLLRRYGQPERFGDEVAYIMLPDTEEAEKKALEADTYHLRPTSQTKSGKDGQDYRAYMLMRGSSTYNTEEFSRLLDGLLEACNEMGIHVMSGREDGS